MINERLAKYLMRLKIDHNLSYKKIAMLAEIDSRTVRDFLKQIPTPFGYTRGVRLEVADKLIRACGGSWSEFVREL